MELSLNEQNRLKSNYGEWAIVTGASSGIGRELAIHLAKAGFNLVINARQLKQLEEMSRHLKSIAPIELKMVACFWCGCAHS